MAAVLFDLLLFFVMIIANKLIQEVVMKSIALLNWYDDSRYITGLKEIFAEQKRLKFYTTREELSFTNIRLGFERGNTLNPGDLIAISISNSTENPKIIGYGRIGIIKKGTICSFSKNSEDLSKNIGAKNWPDVFRDMCSIYGNDKVDGDSGVTIIEVIV